MRLQLRIGPATIAVVADCPPDDVGRMNYVPFLSTDAAVSADLTLRIHTDAPPARGEARLIGELPQHWELYSQDIGYRLEIMEQVTFRPRQIVLLHRGLDQGDVYLLPHPAMPLRGWFLAPLMTPLIQWWLAASLAISREGLILHASAVAMHDLGLAFVGESGAGKTTVARWCARGGAVVLNDERIVIWRSAGGYNVSGTPWHGEWPEIAAQTVPLAGLFVLNKGQRNCFVPWPPSQVVARVVSEAFLPIWSADAMAGVLEAAERMARAVPTGALQFVNDSTVADHLVKYVDDFAALRPVVAGPKGPARRTPGVGPILSDGPCQRNLRAI